MSRYQQEPQQPHQEEQVVDRLIFDDRYLTDEQEAIVRYEPQAGEKVVINAFAGCGKTTTMRALVHYKCEHRPPDDPRQFLYIVYNIDMERAAREAFRLEENKEMQAMVKVCTYHSLMLAYFRYSLGERNIEIEENVEFDFETRGAPFGLHANDHKAQLTTLERFCRDPSIAYIEPQPKHAKDGAADLDIEVTEEILTDEEKLALREARRMWHAATNAATQSERLNIETGEQQRVVKLTHDVTLKYFTLQAQDAEQYVSERYHTVLVDEAQDVQRPLMAWLLEHMNQLPVYLVGDTFQSIYAFAGAHNAIEEAGNHQRAKCFRLTCSFRFGSTIARSSTSLLHATELLQSDVSISGNDAQRGCGTVHRLTRDATPQMAHKTVQAVYARTGCRNIAMLARWNDSAMIAAITLYKNAYHVRLAGRMATWVQTALSILKKYKNPQQIMDRLCEFKRFEQLQEKRQLVHRRHHLESEQLPPRSSGYHEKGLVRGRDRLNEQQRFEQAILERSLEDFHTTYNMFKGMHEQTTAKTVPADAVCVTVCTVYAAKGQEWDAVILIDDFPELQLCIDARLGTLSKKEYDEWQERNSGDSNNHARTHQTIMTFFSNKCQMQLRQELHLYYVAMTRPKHYLFMNAPAGDVVNDVPTLECGNGAERNRIDSSSGSDNNNNAGPRRKRARN